MSETAVAYKKIYTALNRCPDGTGELAAALAKAVPGFLPLVRNRVSHFAKKGPDGKPIPDYADLAQCHKSAAKSLAEQGLAVVQTLTNNSEGEMVLCTQLLHSSGQYIESLIPIKQATSPQQMAASITYARRTAYCAMLGLAADDDDDGATAEQASAGADLADTARVGSLAMAALEAAKNPNDRASVLARASKSVQEGRMNMAQLQAMKDRAVEIDADEAKKQGSARRRPAAVAADAGT
jgi:hypothetical protein